jgi:hypothetical protein
MKKLTSTKGKAALTEVQPPVYPFFCKVWNEKISDGNCDPIPDHPDCKECQVNLSRKNQPGKITEDPKKAKPVTIKERERLRWKYTRRSEKFNRYFNTWNEIKDSPIPESWKNEYKRLVDAVVPMDIFASKSFEEWWKKSGEFWAKDFKRVFPPAKVENFLEGLPQTIKEAWNWIAEKKGREPNLDELLEGIRKLYSDQHNTLVLKITMCFGTPEEAKKIVEETKDRLNKLTRDTRFKKTVIERHLRVFDLRQSGLKWKDIFSKVYPDLKAEDFQEKRRSLYDDFERAKRKKENLEEGEFFWWSGGVKTKP